MGKKILSVIFGIIAFVVAYNLSYNFTKSSIDSKLKDKNNQQIEVTNESETLINSEKTENTNANELNKSELIESVGTRSKTTSAGDNKTIESAINCTDNLKNCYYFALSEKGKGNNEKALEYLHEIKNLLKNPPTDLNNNIDNETLKKVDSMIHTLENTY
ncbi:MAG: hypothetical protein AB1782_20420 [Cyanobacteriota bacterium]